MMIYGFCRRHLFILFVLQSWCIKSFCPLRNFPCWNFPFLLWAQRLFDFQLELFLSQLLFKVDITFTNFPKWMGEGVLETRKKERWKKETENSVNWSWSQTERWPRALCLNLWVCVAGRVLIVKCNLHHKVLQSAYCRVLLELGTLCVLQNYLSITRFRKVQKYYVNSWPLVSGKIENSTRWPITPLLSYQASGQ